MSYKVDRRLDSQQFRTVLEQYQYENHQHRAVAKILKHFSSHQLRPANDNLNPAVFYGIDANSIADESHCIPKQIHENS